MNRIHYNAEEWTYATEEQREAKLQRWHTVESMMREHHRSRSWAYQMIASHPQGYIVLVSLATGRRERAIPRSWVQRYIQRTRRGNPYW